MPAVTIVDMSTMGQERRWKLPFLQERLSVAELLRQRIYQEVREYNARRAGLFQGLVQPVETERVLNGYQLKMPERLLDWQAQYEQALAAFSKHSFLVLIDGHQATELTESITIHTGSCVTFFKLVPLVGG